MLNYLIFFLLLATSQAQVLETYFLGPNPGGYYFGVRSDQAGLCANGFTCRPQPMLSGQMIKIYTECGFHDFTDHTYPYVFGTNVTSLPHQVQLDVYVKTGINANISKCIFEQSENCLPLETQKAISCLQIETDVPLDSTTCMPEWSQFLVVGAICVLIPIVAFGIYKYCKRRKRYLMKIVDVEGEDARFLSSEGLEYLDSAQQG